MALWKSELRKSRSVQLFISGGGGEWHLCEFGVKWRFFFWKSELLKSRFVQLFISGGGRGVALV